MASRPELVFMCQELGIEFSNLSMSEMKKLIREEVDKRFKSKKIHYSADTLSYALKKFLTTEWDYKIYDKKGEEIKFK
jgi:hypothetical protein